MAEAKSSRKPGTRPAGKSEAAEQREAHARQRRNDPTAALAEYRKRRAFDHTAEPAGGPPVRRGKGAEALPIFVVQKHAASHLHYDLRLEIGGVLKSWAVPKGPSVDPAERRLAVMVEDHPLEYAGFEGTIPEDEYGGGTVMVWDFGYWEPDLGRKPTQGRDSDKDESKARATRGAAAPAQDIDPESAVQAGELKFVLYGHKLKGSWVLVQMKGRGDKNWLLLKHRDEEARQGYDVEEETPDSVLTGRSIDQIAADARGDSDGEK